LTGEARTTTTVNPITKSACSEAVRYACLTSRAGTVLLTGLSDYVSLIGGFLGALRIHVRKIVH